MFTLYPGDTDKNIFIIKTITFKFQFKGYDLGLKVDKGLGCIPVGYG